MKLTKNERLRRHFAAGGCALSHVEIAAMFDISPAAAANLITYLESKGCNRWLATVERQERRYLVDLQLVGPEQTVSDQIRKAMAENPRVKTAALVSRFGCSDGLVHNIRRELDGTCKRKTPKDKQASSHRRPGKGAAPTRHWPDEVPHLVKAARFRQLWPVARN